MYAKNGHTFVNNPCENILWKSLQSTGEGVKLGLRNSKLETLVLQVAALKIK